MNETLNRSVAQFFFEVGYGACFAEALVQNDMKPPFVLSDEHIEAAWPRSIEAHEDHAEMDRMLALAAALSPALPTDGLVERLRAEFVIRPAELVTIVMEDGAPRNYSTGEVVQRRNPDGPEAATLITQQSATISRLTAELGEARGKALREAADVCLQQAKEFLSEQYATPQPVGSMAERFACNECAAAILALGGQQS